LFLCLKTFSLSKRDMTGCVSSETRRSGKIWSSFFYCDAGCIEHSASNNFLLLCVYLLPQEHF
jgi:hypothetical protein